MKNAKENPQVCYTSVPDSNDLYHKSLLRLNDQFVTHRPILDVLKNNIDIFMFFIFLN